ncbi:hypothetical protein GCM10010400_70180 [Streptomyces aculeolatus]|uniref:TetR/AcrR family transcriptional regulator n=1 Tax=Streptomyces aculeolatus TaxID=270689 RepID=UPI001CED9B51|nr:TetR family transcriptional regulator C-terminal domain-containing protein [Streptomyces aculeolatus]
MPRTADHAARRREIAAAVRHLVATAGLDAVKVAAVAREAGISVGLVQHYFASKDDLLLFAYEQVTGAFRERVAGWIARGTQEQRRISDVVFHSLLEQLPLDEDRRAEYRVTRAFLGRSLDNAALAEVARATAADFRGQLATAVHNGKECGEVAADVDGDVAAARIAALVTGLADQLYQEPAGSVGGRPAAAVGEELLRECLDGVFTGECRQYRR